jgi:hypothetical protein
MILDPDEAAAKSHSMHFEGGSVLRKAGSVPDVD